MELIEPKVDIAFKKIFGVEENADLLISLINSIVSEEDQVVEVKILNPYNAKEFKNDKLSILDIKATNQDGKKFNIEIQITDEGNYDQRALYYWAKLYTQQLTAKVSYARLAKTIGIHILNFDSVPGPKDRYHNKFIIREEEIGTKYFTDFEMHTIELSKFTENLNDDLQSLMARVRNKLDLWMAFLTRHDLLDRQELENRGSEDVSKALEVLSVMNFTKEEREKYDEHEKWLWMEANALVKRYDDGKSDGIVEGKTEAQIESARNLLLMNVDLTMEQIAKGSGLSVSEVERIASELQKKILNYYSE
jgi:predicted transposase/invertase (TIGR01784 family)